MHQKGEPVGRCLTGIKGLDEMLGGGLPKGSSVLVCGGPGSGKTILSSQFLYFGAREYNEPGIFVSLSENGESIKQNMLKLGWNLEELVKQRRLAIYDLSSVAYLSPEEFHKAAYGIKVPEFTIESTIAAIRDRVETLKAKRIVIDSLTSLSVHEADEAKRRRNIAHLLRGLVDTGCTCLTTSEIRASALEREFQIEEYLADGVILLQTLIKGSELTKIIQIEKMRGVAHDTQPRLYRITSNGIVVFHQDTVI